jgi:hypothetical protein
VEVLPFWISIALLSIVQGLCVALVRPPALALLRRLRGRRWALIPPLSVIAFVLVVRAAEGAGSQGLTYLALVAVPVLAAVALAWLSPAANARWALLVPALFALAWADRRGLPGEAAAVALTALSGIAFGALLAAATPPSWLAGGIVAMAAADTALVVSDLLQRPNNALNAAHPAAGLPRLQAAVLGSAVMGYGDLFIAGVLGGLLALTAGRALQLRGALLTAALALAFDLLFFAVDELPATVPVALALIVLALARRSRASSRRAGAVSPARPVRAGAARTPAAR